MSRKSFVAAVFTALVTTSVAPLPTDFPFPADPNRCDLRSMR